jgi:Transcriptional regulator containing GAF, AAA-type ATPase, and DNA binding domains
MKRLQSLGGKVNIVASSAFACNAPVNARARKVDNKRILLESEGLEVRARLFWQTWGFPHQVSPLGISGEDIWRFVGYNGEESRTEYHLVTDDLGASDKISPKLSRGLVSTSTVRYLPIRIISMS